ncbi:MAG: hypothetical protein PME_48030 [Priestia megaterium]
MENQYKNHHQEKQSILIEANLIGQGGRSCDTSENV